MFGRVKKQENQFVIAIKNFSEIEKALKTETLKLPFEKSIYRNLLDSSGSKVNDLKDLNKFIKSQNKSKGDVRHYWEGLILEGYTLMNVQYENKIPSMERICEASKFKLICRV